jgi:signal transduction histidine kinase
MGTVSRNIRRPPRLGSPKRKPGPAASTTGAEDTSKGPPETGAKARDPLLSAICHDLRAPLAAVTMGATFILQTTRDDDANARSRRILEAMLRSCAQMERLVRNFADLSEIEGDSVVLRRAAHDAGEIAVLASESVREAASARSITLEVEKPDPPVTLACDRDRLLRGLAHLVENAVKAVPEGSSVQVAVVPSEDEVRFQVTDHGPGIPEDVREHLFDRQFHARRANRAGTGFGLAIARGFTAAHGGRVDVEAAPGQTTIALVVPRHAGDQSL